MIIVIMLVGKDLQEKWKENFKNLINLEKKSGFDVL